MKVRTSGMRGFALMALSALAFTACEDKSTTPPPPPPAVSVAVVPQSATLQVGQTQDFAAIVSNASNTAVTWASSNSSVASVSANGRVTAVAAGSAIITATSAQDPTKVGAASVVVTAPSVNITLQLLPSAATISTTGTVQLTSIVTGTTNTGVTYTSSNPAAATVNASGLVSGVAPGTTTIIGRSVANTAVVDESVITVVAGTPGQNVTITITPTQATIGTNGTQTFVATVGGTSNTAVTWASSDQAVATIDANGVATAKGAGTTVITATSVADPTKSVTATLTVSASIQPSISIQSVAAGTGLFATPVSSGATVAGPVEVKVNVSAGTNTNIERVEIRLTNSANESVVACRQTFSPPLAPTQGVAQITCVVNTAELDPTTGAPLFPNGVYTLTAVAISGGADVATATFGTLNLQNANRVAGAVSWDNSLDDTDNDPDDITSVDSNGMVWYGGAATVTLTPAIFQGTQIATIKVSVIANCGAGETVVATRTATIANNTGSVTFPESGTTAHIDALENGSVCFRVFDARDANNASVPLSATAGADNVTTTGTTLNPVVGPGQNQFRVDNVEPTFDAAPMTLDPADFDGLTTDAFLGIGESFARSGSSPTNILNANATDGGVGGVTYKMYAVRDADFVATAGTGAPTQAGLAAAVAHANTQEFTNANDLIPTLNADEYVLVVEAKDALGNVVYKGNRNDLQFGVDLSAPTIVVVEGSSEPASSINNPDGQMRYRFQVTDEGSGAEGVRGTVRGHSVFEIDADAGVEIRCYAFDGTFLGNATSSGACATQTSTGPVFTEGAIEYYDVLIPADENFYEFTIRSFDAARNQSAATITRDALIDVTAGPDAGTGAAAVQINEYTINNVSNTASVTGLVRDNIDVREYDARFEFAGLMSNDGATDLPDAVPFTMPLVAGAYGLPLVGQVGPTTIATAVNVDRIARNPTDAAPYAVTTFGFGMKDVAENFTYGGVAVPPGTYNGFPTSFLSFALEATAGATGPFVIDRTPGGGRPGSTTLTAVATTSVGASSPLSRVYFYYVNPGSDLAYGTADDHMTLIAEPVSSPTVLTGETVREFRWNQTLSASSLPANVDQFQFRVLAIGVDAEGDAVMTEVELVTVWN